MLAHANEWCYTYEAFRDEMLEISKKHPHSILKCISPRNGVTFCGLIPHDSDGTIIELIPNECHFLGKPRKVFIC